MLPKGNSCMSHTGKIVITKVWESSGNFIGITKMKNQFNILLARACVNPGMAPPSLSAYYILFPFTATNGSEDNIDGDRVFVYTQREGGRQIFTKQSCLFVRQTEKSMKLLQPQLWKYCLFMRRIDDNTFSTWPFLFINIINNHRYRPHYHHHHHFEFNSLVLVIRLRSSVLSPDFNKRSKLFTS